MNFLNINYQFFYDGIWILTVSESENNKEKRKNKTQIKNTKSYSNISDYSSYSYHTGPKAEEVYCPEDNMEDNNNNINDLSIENSEELNISNGCL